VRGGGDHRHEVAVLGIGDRLLHLLRRPPGGDEDHLVQTEDALHLAGGEDVAVMDGIERPAHPADPSSLQLHGCQRSESAVFLRFLSRLRWCAPPVSQVNPSSTMKVMKMPMPTAWAGSPSLADAPDSARIMS